MNLALTECWKAWGQAEGIAYKLLELMQSAGNCESKHGRYIMQRGLACSSAVDTIRGTEDIKKISDAGRLQFVASETAAGFADCSQQTTTA